MPPVIESPQGNAPWSVDKARKLYNLARWSGGFFDINTQGHLIAKLDHKAVHAQIDIYDLVRELKQKGIAPPVLVRFQHILRQQLDRLRSAFASGISRSSYTGRHVAVYPIKVNQQHCVVKQILRHGGPNVGLEAGSKPELMAVMALIHDNEGIVVCNGYKDREYVRLALIGRHLGLRIYLVIEKPSELELIIEEARTLDINPLLGMRVRLASIAKGKWQNSGGEGAKFGLNASQVLALFDRLRQNQMISCMQLLHFHMGSQIPDLNDLRKGLREAGRYYAELCQLGLKLEIIDVGGGLGIDYEGTSSTAYCSANYTVQEYADTVVDTVANVCYASGLSAPDIFSEVGRAMTAHHAVLITNVIDVESISENRPLPPAGEAPQILSDFDALLHRDPCGNIDTVYHQAKDWINKIEEAYSTGEISLHWRAYAEQLFNQACRCFIVEIERSNAPVFYDELELKLADKYFCNFSVFQSVPDVWAFNQIFPIVPLHRLDEEPTRRGVLQDLTCDSDGQIKTYVDGKGVESTLALHEINQGEPYLLGLFLVGAYQEILGDEHNLFGKTHSVNVDLAANGQYEVDEPLAGDTVSHLLRSVHYDPAQLLDYYRRKVDAAPLNKRVAQDFLRQLSAGLSGYTYLED